MVQLGHFFKEASGNRPVGQIGQARVNLHQKYCQSASRKHFMIPVTRWQFKVYAWLCFGSMLSRWAAALDCPRLVCYLRIHSLGFITSHLSNSKKMHLVDGLYILPVSYSYIYNIYTTIWLFSIAMENPNHKWRFSSLGKSSASMGHGFQFASIYIYIHITCIYLTHISTLTQYYQPVTFYVVLVRRMKFRPWILWYFSAESGESHPKKAPNPTILSGNLWKIYGNFMDFKMVSQDLHFLIRFIWSTWNVPIT